MSRESYGVQTPEDELLDLPLLSQVSGRPWSSTIDDLILKGPAEAPRLEQAIANTTNDDRRKATVNPKTVRVLAPVVSPPKIVCLGLNYRDHAAEQKASLPTEPIIFMKPRTAIIGPDDSARARETKLSNDGYLTPSSLIFMLKTSVSRVMGKSPFAVIVSWKNLSLYLLPIRFLTSSRNCRIKCLPKRYESGYPGV